MYTCVCVDLIFLTRSRVASPVHLSTLEEAQSFLLEVPHPELAGYQLDRVVGLFEAQTQTGKMLLLCIVVAREASVQMLNFY